MDHADYLIVGAGLAGSTCAYLLKQAGCDVLLVERLDVETKSKLCAGLVTPRALRELDMIFDTIPNNLFKSRFNTMRCIAAGITVDLHDIQMRSVERRELDRFVLDAYRADGGELLDRFHVRSIDIDNKQITGTLDGEVREISFGTLIAADGALSFVRRHLTGNAPDAILSLETTVANTGAPLTMDYEDGFIGYSWYAPCGDEAKIGCCAYMGEPNLDQRLRSFAKQMGVEYERCRGAFIPTGSDVLLEHGGVYFVGDAASLIAPPSGEGIYHALHSARMLARALVNAASYRALMRHVVTELRRQYKLRSLFFDTRFMRCGIKLAGATPYGAERAVKFALRHFAGY
ncbi:MAG: NAD(P)/FAD-dependent oxidoreductase [Coriobacteriales bacterium]